jgi:eukaryotic-like serine/threonine-protein kinase
MPLAAGSGLGSYEIIALLGAGRMGEVYRARDLTLKREVAIKVLPAYCASDPDRLRRLELEAQSTGAQCGPYEEFNGHDLLTAMDSRHSRTDASD